MQLVLYWSTRRVHDSSLARGRAELYCLHLHAKRRLRKAVRHAARIMGDANQPGNTGLLGRHVRVLTLQMKTS